MHATIRQYQGKELADFLAERQSDVEAVIAPVQGLRSYDLIRTEDGCASITVCDSAAGTEESTRRAADWMRQNAGHLSRTTPQVASGEVIVHIGSEARV